MHRCKFKIIVICPAHTHRHRQVWTDFGELSCTINLIPFTGIPKTAYSLNVWRQFKLILNTIHSMHALWTAQHLMSLACYLCMSNSACNYFEAFWISSVYYNAHYNYNRSTVLTLGLNAIGSKCILNSNACVHSNYDNSQELIVSIVLVAVFGFSPTGIGGIHQHQYETGSAASRNCFFPQFNKIAVIACIITI